MQLKAIVQFQGGLAHYQISPGHEGIFEAMLMRYDGRPERTPPGKVVLTKEADLWSGSSDRQDLVDQLGHRIEKRLMHGDAPNEERGPAN
jgi:hypothetical protein